MAWVCKLCGGGCRGRSVEWVDWDEGRDMGVWMSFLLYSQANVAYEVTSAVTTPCVICFFEGLANQKK